VTFKVVNIKENPKDKALIGSIGTMRRSIAFSYSKALVDGNPIYPSINATIIQDGRLPTDIYTPSTQIKYVTNDPIIYSDFDDDGGWIYNKTTGEIRVDLPGYHEW